MKHSQTLPLTVAALAAVCVSTSTRAADPIPVPPHWESSAAAGITLTRGNSSTFLGTLALATGKKWDVNELSFGADAAYGTTKQTVHVNGVNVTQTDTTAESLHGFAQYNRLFTERWYGYGRIEGLHDGVADIHYRLTLSPGAGYYFIKDKITDLSAEAGPALITQKLGDESKTYLTLRIGEKFHHAFTEHARMWQMAEFLPQVDDLNNYIINGEIGVEADLNTTGKLSLRTYLQDTYNNVPAKGRQKNDAKLVAAIAYKF
jgi:putative salt-induced outer membrane protein YdiY